MSFASKQLKTVAFSSCEAEYAAASYACKEIEFVRNICADMDLRAALEAVLPPVGLHDVRASRRDPRGAQAGKHMVDDV